MDPNVRARLGAARLVLDEHFGTASHELVSRTQSAAFLSVLSSATLTAEQKADLTVGVLQCKWHGLDSTAVMQMLAAPVVGHRLGLRRRASQSFEAMFQYGTEGFWQDLLAPSVTSVKLDLLLQLAVRLGLRTPSEPTLKFMTSWWLVASESTRELGRLTAAQKHTYLLHVKGQFHALAKLLPDPLEHLAQLPSDPLTLLRDHGAMFHNVFAEKATPVAPRIQLGDVLEFNHSYGCRGGGRHTVPATAQLALGMPDTAVQQVADVMASQQRMIEQMLAHSAGSQHSGYRHPKAFDLMMMGGGHSSGSGRLAQLLDAPSTAAMSVVPVLGNSPPAVQQQLQPQIQVQPQLQQLQLQPQLQLRSQPPVQQQVVPPRPSQGQLQLQPPVQPQVQVQPPVQQQVVSSQPSQGQPAADFLTDMLDTLAERDGERKAEAKRVKLGASAAKPVATNTRLRKKTSVHTDGEGDDKAAVHSGGRVRKAAVHSGGDHGKGAAIAKALEAYTNYTQLVQRGMQYKGKHFNSNILAAVR
jgi:hypothetical protein